MKNNYRGGVGAGKGGFGGDDKEAPQSPGVMGRSHVPGFSDYPQTSSPNFPDIKFAETGIGTAKDTVNQLRTASKTSLMGRAKQATTTTMNTSSNNYRRGVDESKRGMNVKKP